MTTAPVREPTPGVGRQLFAYLGGMAAYAVHLLASPPLVPAACGLGSTWPLHLLTALVLVVIALAGLVAWRLWRGGAGDDAGGDAGGSGLASYRRRFLGLGGMMLNALAFAVVVFAEVPNHFLHPCLP